MQVDPTAHDRLVDALSGPERTIYTLTTYGRGETDHVRVFIVDDSGISEITYLVAHGAMRKARIVPGKGIPMGGGNYSKALEVADWAARAAWGHPLDQSLWQEL